MQEGKDKTKCVEIVNYRNLCCSGSSCFATVFSLQVNLEYYNYYFLFTYFLQVILFLLTFFYSFVSSWRETMRAIIQSKWGINIDSTRTNCSSSTKTTTRPPKLHLSFRDLHRRSLSTSSTTWESDNHALKWFVRKTSTQISRRTTKTKTS